MAMILVVDDRPTNREYLVTLLSYGGHQLLEASDGQEGLAVARAEPPDLILTDIVMPRMDGYEFARQVRADPRLSQTQVVFFTSSHIVDETRQLAAGCGVSHIIAKPAEADAIIDVVKSALDRQSSPPLPAMSEAFHLEHLRLLTDTLAKKVDELEAEVAERRRTEEALRAKSEELAAVAQQLWQSAKLAAIGELAAGIVHDIGNPLTAIQLNAQLLQRSLPPASDDRESADFIVQAVARTMGTVRELLDFSRQERQPAGPVDVNLTIRQAASLAERQLRSDGIALVYDLAEPLPTVVGSRDHLQTVWLNLILNARDATIQPTVLLGKTVDRQARREIRLSSRRLDQSVEVRVSDTGDGISPELLTRIFEPFFTTKSEGKGTGLGLSICRRVAQEFSGTIEILSEVGQGTTVRLVLPAAVEAG